MAPRRLSVAPAGDWLALAVLCIATLLYLRAATGLAASAPLWMDETLALWTARQPDLAAVWSALARGSEFSPPLYDSALHLLVKAGVTTPLGYRLPSILAGLAAALAAGAFTLRHAGRPFAALAVVAMLAGGIFEYAVQARPYVFVAAAFGWALVVWDRLPDEGALPRRRLLILAALLAALVALNFYALLLVLWFVPAECVRRGLRRQWPRAPVLAVVAVAAASILLWTPILQAASAFSGQDVFAPGYYGRPRFIVLIAACFMLAGWTGLLALAVALVLLVTRRRSLRPDPLLLTSLLLLCIPPGIFLFALLISHSFAPRYVIAAGFGFAFVLVWVVKALGEDKPQAALAVGALLLVLPGSHYGGEIAKTDRRTTLALVAGSAGDLPIATGSGLRYFELVANMPPRIARRIAFLDLPAAGSADPTNRNQVVRWKAIDARLQVVDARGFLCATPRFLLLTDPEGGIDAVPGWLAERLRLPAIPADRPALTLVERPAVMSNCVRLQG